MANKELGIADPVYDALRIRSGQSIAPDLGSGIPPGGGSGLENKIYLWHGDGSTIDLFEATGAGLNLANAAAVSGDTVWLPSIAITLSGALTVAAGVIVTGISWDAILTGTVVNNGTLENLRINGNLTNGAGARAQNCFVRVATGTGITQAANAIIDRCNIQMASTATYGIDISDGSINYTTVGTEGGATNIGIYAHGANVEIHKTRASGNVGANVEQAYIIANCEFHGASGTPSATSHGLTHATTSTARLDNCTFICFSANSFGASISATGLTLTDCAWNSIDGIANVTYGTGDRGAYSVEDFHATDIEAAVLTRHLPAPTNSAGDAGKFPKLNDAGSAYELSDSSAFGGAGDAYADTLAVGFGGVDGTGFPVKINQQYPSLTSVTISAVTYQATAYIDSNRYMVIATRILDGAWTLYTYNGSGGLPTIQVIGDDNHNYATVALDKNGYLHVCYNHHIDPLHYRKSTNPINTFAGALTAELPMLGTNETQVSYPTFYRDPSSELYFTFRDGMAGNGDLYFYAYNAGTTSWAAATGTGTGGLLVQGKTGSPTQNAYWDHVSFDSNFGAGGYMHLSWAWRALGATREHDESYAKWDGTNWKKSDGSAQTVPITLANCEIVDSATAVDALVAVNSNYSDSTGVPHIVYIKKGADGYRHLFHAYKSTTWVIKQISTSPNVVQADDSYPDGRTPNILINRTTHVAYIFFLDSFDLPGMLLWQSAPNDFTVWQRSQIYPFELGNVRTGIDYEEWARSGVVYFILPFWSDKDNANSQPIKIMKWTPNTSDTYTDQLHDHTHSASGDGGAFDAATLTSGAAGDGTVLTADGVGGAAWEAIPTPSLALNDLTDVDTTGTGTGDIIYNNAGTWQDYALGIGSRVTASGTKIRFGNVAGGNYLEIDAVTGTLRLVGDATTWDDFRVEASVIKPGATAPNWKAFGPSGNLQALMFEASHHDEAYFELQMPHNWLIGSNLYPHVHWTPVNTTAGNVVWELEYSWANVGDAFGAPGNMATDATAAGGVAWVHKLTDFKSGGNNYIDGTGKTLSSMLVCRLHRNSNAGSDTLNQDVALLEVDFHYQIDSLGSDERLVKDASASLLLETGDILLLETGDRLLTE